MPLQAIFGISILFSFLAWGGFTARYFWPALHRMSRIDALRALLTLHTFRFVGMSFLVPGVVSPSLSRAFSVPAAYGDVAAAILALLALATLPGRAGLVLTWIFSVWGTLDLLNAFFEGSRIGLPVEQFGAAFYIPTLIVPLALITHGLVFRLLLQRNEATAARPDRAVTAAPA